MNNTVIIAAVTMTNPVNGEKFPYTLVFSDKYYNNEMSLTEKNQVLDQLGRPDLRFGRNAGFASLNSVGRYVTQLTCNYVPVTDKYVANLTIGKEYDMRIVRENASELIATLDSIGLSVDYDSFTRQFSFDITQYA